MNTDYKNIFIQSSCLSNDEMIDYISGNLSKDKIRKVEMHIADCEMCNDELEGLQILNDNEKLPKIISSLNNKIDSYFDKKEISIPITSKNKKTFSLKKTFSIAASVALLVTAAYFIYDIKNNVASENIAEANVSEKSILKEENAIIESVKPEESKIEENEVLTSNAEKDKTETSINENAPLKENAIQITDKNTPETKKEIIINDDATLTEEVSEDETISDISENKNNLASESDVTETSNNSKAIFGATRGGDVLRKKKASKNYKYLKDSGLLSYNIKSYKDAISDFNKYLQHNPNDFEVVFKIGMSYYYTKKYDAAISKFNKITSTKNIKYFENAQWYKANALLKQNKKGEALTILNKIVEDAGKFSQKAKIKVSEIK